MKRKISISLLLIIILASLFQFAGCSRADSSIKVVSVSKYLDTKGSQQLNIIIKNTTSDKTIKDAEIYVKCYSAKKTLLSDRANGQSVYCCQYFDCNLASGQLSSDNLFFNYSGFDDISYCDVAVKSITLSDGTRQEIDDQSLDYINLTVDTISD